MVHAAAVRGQGKAGGCVLGATAGAGPGLGCAGRSESYDSRMPADARAMGGPVVPSRVAAVCRVVQEVEENLSYQAVLLPCPAGDRGGVRLQGAALADQGGAWRCRVQCCMAGAPRLALSPLYGICLAIIVSVPTASDPAERELTLAFIWRRLSGASYPLLAIHDEVPSADSG